MLILPNDQDPPEEPRFVPIGGRASRNLRLAHAQQIAARAAAELGAELFDCSAGDLAELYESLTPDAKALPDAEIPF